MKLNIRPMRPADKPSLMTILLHTPEFTPPEVAVAEEVISSYLYDPNSYNILVADIDKHVDGYICYGRTPLTENTWDIYWLAVPPEKQRHGIGSALLTAAEERISKVGGRMIMIETSSKPDYHKTRHFYLDRGYEIVGRIGDFYAPGDAKIILRKKISS